ncbi:unnamed protein product [Clonostachys byssicola]|uniref:Uncharacterized protein n=1 Tax=Clonostachys byssicola TaxID=160290 RepID=A0A9N9U1E6_9HYPO|nr:unnamed protein product [Clonostachys byssicola]
MGFDKRAFLAAFRASNTNDSEKEPPPPYQEEEDRPRSDESGTTPEIPPPGYDKAEAKPAPKEKGKQPGVEGFDASKRPPIPVTAAYLLQKDEESKKKLQATVDGFCGAPDPSMFEFEFVCLLCFEYETECLCSISDPKTTTDPWQIPQIKKPKRSLRFPAKLATEIGDKPAHLSAAIAQSLWPAITRGMIPIFNDNSLVVLRSRALERMQDPKEILKNMVNPVSTLLSAVKCRCGCQLEICQKIRSRYGLESKESIEECSVTSYKVRTRTFNAIRLPYGITCFDLSDIGIYEIKTADEEDFLFYCSILPTFWNVYPSPKPKNDPADINWHVVLESLLHETLTLQNNRMSRYEILPIRAMCHKDGSTRAVMRTENFAAGPGFLIMETPSAPSSPKYSIIDCGYSLRHVSSINSPRTVDTEAFMSQATSAQPRFGSLETVSVGKGWGSLSLDPGSDGHLYLKKRYGPFIKRTMVGLPRRGSPGKMCNGNCSGKKASTGAYFAGFAPPTTEPNQTTVYVLDKDPLAWVVVSQWASSHPRPLIFVSHKQCLVCTILESPAGSIIASGLPPVALFGSMIT